VPEELQYANCCVCGVRHAFPKAKKEWWCPNGHALTLLDVSEIDRLKKEKKYLRRSLEEITKLYRRSERRRKAQKSATTRLRNKFKALQKVG